MNSLLELNVRNLFKRIYRNLAKVKSEDTQNLHKNEELTANIIQAVISTKTNLNLVCLGSSNALF